MTYVKIDGREFPAKINGFMVDHNWDNRESKTIHIDGDFEEMKSLFVDDAHWSIVQREEVPVYDEDGNHTVEIRIEETEFDNSEFSISGDITDHRDGTISIKMGKPTDLELAYEELYG